MTLCNSVGIHKTKAARWRPLELQLKNAPTSRRHKGYLYDAFILQARQLRIRIAKPITKDFVIT